VNQAARSGTAQRSSIGFLAASLVLVTAVAAIASAIKLMLRLPGVPYNVSDLFLDHASAPAVAIFAVALLWIGAGPMCLAHLLIRTRHPATVLPVGTVILAFVSRTLLKYSVTYESLDDILGMNNVFDRVTKEKIWGDWWGHLFLTTSAAHLVPYLERRIRFIALYSPLAVCLALALLAFLAVKGRHRFGSSSELWLLASAAIWLWLCKLITFNGAATDNLTELIAQHGVLGGLPYLYLIAVLVALNVAFALGLIERRLWLLVIVLSGAAVPAGWMLLGLGLERHVEKYGVVFSGAQFLLGPDRQHVLSEVALFARWTVVQTGGVAVMTTGAWIAHRFITTRT
jgi:hypothetical protein